MNDRARATRVAVVCNRQSGAAAGVDAHLQAHGITDAVWYAPSEVDDVDRVVRAGQVARVVFPALSDFLAVLWDEVLTVEAWQAPGMAIEFAEPDNVVPAAQVSAILERWRQWQLRRHRQRAVAGLILSALAVAAAWVLVALTR